MQNSLLTSQYEWAQGQKRVVESRLWWYYSYCLTQYYSRLHPPPPSSTQVPSKKLRQEDPLDRYQVSTSSFLPLPLPFHPHALSWASSITSEPREHPHTPAPPHLHTPSGLCGQVGVGPFHCLPRAACCFSQGMAVQRCPFGRHGCAALSGAQPRGEERRGGRRNSSLSSFIFCHSALPDYSSLRFCRRCYIKG